jgi:thioredoxin-like negative regulator of GroEL
MVLPFIEDDFAAAEAKARQTGKLLMVDVWALWCHTCLSMRNFVFTDPLLREVADRFVDLSIDTEQPGSAAFVQRYPIKSWPTMLVLAPGDAGAESPVLARWVGAMTARELLGRLRELAAAPTSPLLAQADAAAAAGRWSEAAGLYEKAAQRPAGRPQALLGPLQALHALGAHAACAELGDTAFAQLGKTALATDFASYAADCLEDYRDIDTRQKLRRRLRARLEQLVQDSQAELLTDDRSDGYGTLIGLADALGEAPAGDRYALARAQLLEAAAKAAPSALVAATFDAHRLDAYRRLKRYAEAEAMLLGSLKALPDDYNPPARLARLYSDLGRLDAALLQINRALALCAGPRRIAMYELRASIQHGLGQTPAALQSLRAAMAIVRGQLRPGAPPSGKLAGLEKLVATMESTQPSGPASPPTAPAAPPSPPRQPVPVRPPTPVYQPGDAVARELEREPVDKKPARPSRKVAKRDTLR